MFKVKKMWNLRGWKQEETQGANLEGKKENIMESEEQESAKRREGTPK